MLQLSYTTTKPGGAGPVGTVFPNAVHCIEGMQVTFDEQNAVIPVNIYEDSACLAASHGRVGTKAFLVTGDDFDDYFSEVELSPVGCTPLSQAYEYLKSLDEYTGAVEV